MNSISTAKQLALRSLWIALLSSWALGCSAGPPEAKWPPTAKKWYDRAEHSYRTGDIDDAAHASESALEVLPDEPKVRLVAGKVALSQLQYEKTLELLQGLPGTEAARLRGRAHWYLGELEKAADALEAVGDDPEVRDPLAEKLARLARAGRGRRPFEMTGGLLAVMDMPRAGSTAMLVPLEVNGEPSLAMVATDEPEAVIDSSSGQGGWISLRFDGRVEVTDVPAVGRDLSGLSRTLGAPVKMLIGVNLLRHLRATIDFSGRQFVVRNYDPPAPPQATTVRPIYYQGGNMVLPGAMGVEQTAPTASLLMRTSMGFPVALDEAAWEKAGQDPSDFAAVPGAAGVRHGTLPMLRLGAFEIPNVPGVVGPSVDETEKSVNVDLDGFAGSGLFAPFRLTLTDGGRTLWMEDQPPEVVQAQIEARSRAQQARRQAPAPVSPGSPPSPAPGSPPSPGSPSPPGSPAPGPPVGGPLPGPLAPPLPEQAP